MKTEIKTSMMNIVCLVLLIAATTFGFTKAYYENKYSQQNVMEQALENVDHIEYANDNIIIIDKQYNEYVTFVKDGKKCDCKYRLLFLSRCFWWSSWNKAN